MTVIVFIRPPTLGFVSLFLKALITIFRVLFFFSYLHVHISLSVDFYADLTSLICSIKYFQPALLLNLEILSLFLEWMDGWMGKRNKLGKKLGRRKDGREGGREEVLREHWYYTSQTAKRFIPD